MPRWCCRWGWRHPEGGRLGLARHNQGDEAVPHRPYQSGDTSDQAPRARRPPRAPRSLAGLIGDLGFLGDRVLPWVGGMVDSPAVSPAAYGRQGAVPKEVLGWDRNGFGDRRIPAMGAGAGSGRPAATGRRAGSSRSTRWSRSLDIDERDAQAGGIRVGCWSLWPT